MAGEENATVTPEAPQPRLVPKGLERRRSLDPLRVAAIASAGWLAIIGAYAVGFFAGAGSPPAPQPQALTVLLFLLGGLGPVALMILAAALLDQVRTLREEMARLAGLGTQGGVEGTRREMRQIGQQVAQILGRLDALDKALGGSGESLAARRMTAPAPPAEGGTGQGALPLEETPAAAPPRVPWADIIRALDFPRSADDQRGFDAIRSAIRDPEIAQLLQAAEDVLAILAAEGLHMEDYAPDHASLGAWRSYADGIRGEAVTAIGGIRDEAALERARLKLRADAVFRDAALVFIRRWNGLVVRILRDLGDDPALRDAADSRTGRAFMLTARALGVFG